MFGTIRRHQKWLWLLIIVPTIITFVWYFQPTSRLNNGGGRETVNVNYGSLNGEPITRERYINAEREAMLHHFLQYGRWPEESQKEQFQRDIYSWLLLIQKQEQMGIHADSQQAAQVAHQLVAQVRQALRQVDPSGQITPEIFASRILPQAGLQPSDFERYCEHYLGLRELIATIGLSGKLLVPDEAKAIYERQNQELATEAVFFSASNYLAGITAAPEAVAQSYSNNLANYRIPERVQVQYVKFSVSNFMAKAEATLSTNLDELVETNLARIGTNYVLLGLGKTSEEARTNIRNKIIIRQAMPDAVKQARSFAGALLEMDPVSPDNLEKLAATNGLAVGLTAPFDEEAGPPKDLSLGADADRFAKSAFSRTPGYPFDGPFVGEDGVYEIASFKRILSEVPPLAQVLEQATSDYKLNQAFTLASQEAETFYKTLTNGLAQGKTFTNICLEAKLKPVSIPPFSRSTRDLTNLDERINLSQVQQIAFITPLGTPSQPRPTRDGSVILFVKSTLPIDVANMLRELPSFTAYLREKQSEDAFEMWFRKEFQKVARELPALQQPSPGPSSQPAKS